MDDIVGLIKNKLKESAQARGIDIVNCDIREHFAHLEIRLTADKTNGISLDECAQLNRDLKNFLELDLCLDKLFTVEVVSPGLDRIMKSRKDFLSVVEKDIRVWTRVPVNGKNEFVGRLKAVEADALSMIGPKDENLTISICDINKARLEIRW